MNSPTLERRTATPEGIAATAEGRQPETNDLNDRFNQKISVCKIQKGAMFIQRDITVMDALEEIRGDRYAAAVAKLRKLVSLHGKKSVVAKTVKNALPAFLPSGWIDGRVRNAMDEGRLHHSGLLQLDFDKLDAPPAIRDQIAQDPHVLAAWISPSGDGVKGIMVIKPAATEASHIAAFLTAEAYWHDRGLTLDAQCKNSNRLMFASHDPDLKFNNEAVQLATTPPPKTAKASPSFKVGSKHTTREELTAQDVREMLAVIPSHPAYDEWLKIASAVWDALGESEGTAALCEWSPEEHAGEYAQKYGGRLERVTAGTLVHIAREHGWKRERSQSTPTSWPCEVELEDELTPFPTHCLPGAAGDMAREIGRVTTAQNEPLAAASVLAILSAAIGAGLEVSTGGERRTRGNLFTLAIAESGTGKGEAYKLAAEPFETLEAEEIEAFDMHTKPGLLAEISVADKRAKSLCSQAAKETDVHARFAALNDYRRAEEERAEIQKRIDSSPRWKVADVTREALAIVLAGQPGEAVASLSSEARGIFSIVKGRYGKEGSDEDLYCSAYSGDSINIDRVGRPRITLRKPCLSILWMVQPDAARKAFNEESFTDSGLLPRFLIFDPKAEPQERYEQPAPIPAAIKSGWATLIRSLAKTYRMNGGDPQAVAVSQEAKDELTEYERENVRRRCRNGDLIDLAPFVARWTENAWKIAIVLHAARHGGNAHAVTLEEATAKNALEVMRWFASRQLETLSAGRREKLQKRLMALMAVMAAAKTEITFRDLKRSHSFQEAEIRQLQAAFPKAFRIEERRAGAVRKSAVVIRL